MENSALWGNLHTELFLGTDLSAAAGVYRSVAMEYGSTLFLTNPSYNLPLPANNGYAHISVGDLSLKEGARVVFDINGSNNASGDKLDVTGSISVTKRDWRYGPPYSAPIFEIRSASKLAAGEYELGAFKKMKSGMLGDIVVELQKGTDCAVKQIYAKEGKYYLHLGNSAVADESEVEMLPNGDYYIQNVASGYFVIGGADWSTRAIAGEGGIDFTITKLTNGKYSFDSKISNGTGKNYLGGVNDPYVDAALAELTVEKLDNGNFTISNGSGLLTQAADGIYLSYAGNDATNERAQWRFLTADEVKKSLEGARPIDPRVATTLISDPNFGRNDTRFSAWTWSSDCTNKSNSNSSSLATNWCVESFHSTFTCSQTLTGIPNGTYLLYAQGFYRQDGSDNTSLPVLFANNETSVLPRLSDSSVNSMGKAGQAFLDGYYQIDPVVVTVTDGSLTVGVRNTINKNLWVIWDNFRLYYIGEVKEGDVNGDGTIDLSDLTTLIGVLNGNDTRLEKVRDSQSGDVNKDGQTQKDDVERLVKWLKNEL